MKKTFTVVVDIETPVIHLLNSKDYDVYQTNGELFTMIKKEKVEERAPIRTLGETIKPEGE